MMTARERQAFLESLRDERETGERLDRFQADFRKLRDNRAKVPALELHRRYGRAYTALVERVRNEGDWYAAAYVQGLAATWPVPESDTGGGPDVARAALATIRRETGPGGLCEQWRAALIDFLNPEKFRRCVAEFYARLEKEAFLPYWRRHCHTGPDGVTRNSLLPAGAYWCPVQGPADPEAGFWTDGYRLYQIGWPPVPVSGRAAEGETENGQGPARR